MFHYEVKIPKDRVAVLIGKKGTVKKKIQRVTKTNLIVDSKECNVAIEGEDSFAAYSTKLIIQAIGRGFNPDIALMLTNESLSLEFVNIIEFSGKSKKKMHRLKARLIGTKGKAWKTIERLTGCFISVYGKTVGIIGPVDKILIAKKAVEDILKGAPHGNVYNWLQDQQKKIRAGL
ncbi:MAG: RNA-processing protein [Nanoarchaeota archaeon]|nr:RNA-processing protein [Nanoarchaeota archaeon]